MTPLAERLANIAADAEAMKKWGTHEEHLLAKHVLTLHRILSRLGDERVVEAAARPGGCICGVCIERQRAALAAALEAAMEE